MYSVIARSVHSAAGRLCCLEVPPLTLAPNSSFHELRSLGPHSRPDPHRRRWRPQQAPQKPAVPASSARTPAAGSHGLALDAVHSTQCASSSRSSATTESLACSSSPMAARGAAWPGLLPQVGHPHAEPHAARAWCAHSAHTSLSAGPCHLLGGATVISMPPDLVLGDTLPQVGSTHVGLGHVGLGAGEAAAGACAQACMQLRPARSGSAHAHPTERPVLGHAHSAPYPATCRSCAPRPMPTRH